MKQEPPINFVIDVRDFLGTPGYSMLVIAANTGLTVPEIGRFLETVAEEYPAVQRSASWMQRRRWLFQQPGTNNPTRKADEDGQYHNAVLLMAEHKNLSAHGLSLLLKDRGIVRSREWVRQHRCDAA